MALLQSEAKKAPNRLDILLLMGATAQREGKFQDSLSYFTRVLNGLDKKSKTRADLYYANCGLTYRLAGDRDSAIANLQKAREIIPENEIVLANLGEVMDQAGRRAEATTSLRGVPEGESQQARGLEQFGLPDGGNQCGPGLGPELRAESQGA